MTRYYLINIGIYCIFVYIVYSFRIQPQFSTKKVQFPHRTSFVHRNGQICNERSDIRMAFDTIVEVKSNFESKCSLNADKGISLTNYMQLPVEQYVCIKMPLDATLSRIDGNKFNLTVPPVTFFNLDVSPTMICRVTQTNEAVLIESSECTLRGSPFVVGLNGCFKMLIKTNFKWIDLPTKRSILSNSHIYVEVDPPAPFKYFGKNILERTGSLALSIALRQIENAFVSSLSRDYEKWANDKAYRSQRAGRFPSKALAASPSISKDTPQLPTTSETISPSISKPSTEGAVDTKVKPTSASMETPINGDMDDTNIEASPEDLEFLDSVKTNRFTSPEVLTDDMCLLPGDPIIRIEEAPSNSRRIYSGIDIMTSVEDVWKVLTDYENLQNVVPSLVRNEIVFRYPDGGARLSQTGAAKVLPGITFTAKTVLDVRIYDEKNPLPNEAVASYAFDESIGSYSGKNQPLKRGVYPKPLAISNLPHRDITMQSVLGEGDFDHYQGLWRMQELPFCAPEGKSATRLTYAVEIRPKGFLPVRLIEGRIASDLKQNLEAIREYVETRSREKTKQIPAVVRDNSVSVAPSPAKIEDVMQGTTPSIAVSQAVTDYKLLEPILNNKINIFQDSLEKNEAKLSDNSSESVAKSLDAADLQQDCDEPVAEVVKPFSFRRMIKNAIGLDLNAWMEGGQDADPDNEDDTDSDDQTSKTIEPIERESLKEVITLEMLYSNSKKLESRIEALEKELQQLRSSTKR